MSFNVDDIDVDNVLLCQIPELGFSCWGCCGRNFKSRKAVERDIRLNTLEFRKIKIPSTIRLLEFRDRLSDDSYDLMPSGICSNLVDFGDGVFACPLHSKINEVVSKDKFLAIHKKDLRVNHCDVNYECESFILWKRFSKRQKRDYLKWLSKRVLIIMSILLGMFLERL